MNKGLLTTLLCILFFANFLNAQNPNGDLRIEMLTYHNLVVDHNIQTPAGASPESVYIGVQICNDGNNDLTDVFAFIGDYNAETPGIYPTVTASSNKPYSGTFSFTHEGGTQDATRYIGDLAAGECITQYWLLRYPLVDANNVPVFGANSKLWDDLKLDYDVWATANDNGSFLEASDSKQVTLRAEISANANKIEPNNTNHVPGAYLNAFPDKELGWHETTNTTHPGATLALEGNWFRLGKVNKGFDNDGDNQRDYNFMIQPVGNPDLFDANCYRLVKVSGLIVIKRNSGGNLEIPFEDQMHFENLPTNNTDGCGFVVYEFAVLDGSCNSTLSPYQEAASGKNNEKFNADFGTPGGSLVSDPPSIELETLVPPTAGPGSQIEISISTNNTTSVALGMPGHSAHLVLQQDIPEGVDYVAGTAISNNTLPSGASTIVLYSSDHGETWETSEPTPANSVTNLQWWINRAIEPNEEFSVTFELNIPPDYSEPSLTVESGISTGNATPFMEVAATIVMQGGLTISDVVFVDNGDGGAILGDGVQSGTEAGLGNINVILYQDLDGNGEVDATDIMVGQMETLLDGSYEFTGLSEGNYIVQVDQTDNDIPAGYTNTSPADIVLLDIAGVATFGFAPLLEIKNTLVSSASAFESASVQYHVEMQNLSYAEDTDNSSTITAWATQLDPATNFDYNKNDLLGPPDYDLSWPSTWTRRAKVKGFDFSGEEGEIEKVELILSVCLDIAVNNDYLTISFQKEDGTTVNVPASGLSKYSSPSLNDYVGPPGLGFIILDVTQYQDWDWDVFDSNWAITMDGVKVGSNDGAKQYTDAIGVRVTSSCCASTGGEPGNPCATITGMPFTYEYDNTQLQFVSASITPDNVSNGVVTFNNVGPLYPNQIDTLVLNFTALQPDGNDVTTTAVVSNGSTGCGMNIVDSDVSDPLTIVNLGSLSGLVFGDVDGDGWQGVTGFENGTDNFVPGVEMNLYGCVDDSGDLIYPAPNKYKSCSHWQNDGHWELLKSDTTNANGVYEIRGVENGYYYLEVNETTMTNAAEQTADPDYTNGVPDSWKRDKRWKKSTDQLRYTGLVGIGNDHVNVNFGYHVTSAIAGKVWQDVDGDGVKGAQEPVVANAKLEFVHSGCTAGVNCPEIFTNGSGNYAFNDAIGGTTYTVSVDLDNIQGAEVWSMTYEPDGSLDNSSNLSVSLGQQLYNQDFGIQAGGDLSMGGTVYYDWSGNAHRNAGDEGIPNVEVKLYKDQNGNGSVQSGEPLVQTIMTGEDGGYLFSNKESANYVIQVGENTLPIFPKQTEDPDEYGPCTTCDARTAVTEQDYVASISDVWNYYNAYNVGCEICDEGYTSSNDDPYIDDNLDVINFQDPIGNPSACISQVEVTFNIAASDFEKDYYTSQVNNIDYHYPIELNGVQIGTFNPIEMPYWCDICESITMVYDVDFSTIPYNFGSTNTLDLNFRSYNMTMPSNQRQDICVADIQLEFIGSSCADSFLELDFGYEPTGETEIRGCVYQDDNNNGYENSGEPRLPGIEMRLQADLNNDATFTQIETTTTNENGEFVFEGMPSGMFRVLVDEDDSDLPTDFTGAQATLSTDNSFDVEVVDDEVVAVDGLPGSDLCGINRPPFGFNYPGTAIGNIYADANGDGERGVDERGIEGVTVYVCPVAAGTCNAINAIDTAITSNGLGLQPTGMFVFGGLEVGDYSIAVDETTVPTGYTLTADPSTDGIPCYTPLNELDPDYAFLAAECDHQIKGFSITSSSQFTGADFGYQPKGVIGDMVWFDDNEDGILDDNEEGLEEVELIARNVSSVTIDGVVYDPGEVTEYAYTDSDGQYTFSDFADGTWEVSLTPPTDYIATYDVDGTNDNTTTVVLFGGELTSAGNSWCAPGEDCSLIVDFGLTPNFLNSVSGTVCLDLDEDGKCDTGGETFPEGASVSIFDELGNFFGQVGVDASGYYSFDNLPGANMVISVSKTNAPLRLTSLTTSLGDTPAFDIEDSDDNSLQRVSISGDVAGVDFGFSFTEDFDLGDLPLPYETRVDAGSSGPAHLLSASPTPYLGATVDSENFPTLQAEADGDDTIGSDDEDGITFADPATWVIGADGGSFTVEVTGDGHLVGFADFNQDGDFDDNGDMIVSRAVSDGFHDVDFDIPAGTDLEGGQDIFFRFRLFESIPFSPMTAHNGIAYNGEVEDYLVSICKNLDDAGIIVGAETGCDGYDPAEITTTHAPSGGSGSMQYQWQESTNGGVDWIDIAGADAETYDPNFIGSTTRFRRGARRARCQAFVYSNAIEKTVVSNYADPGAIVGDEDNCGIYDPGLITSVVAPSGGSGTSTPEYQWEYRTDANPTWTIVLNADLEYYDPGVISVTTEYRRGSRKSPCAPYLYSNIIRKMISVNYVSAGTIGGDQSICGPFDPTEITSHALPSGGVDGYEQMQWEMSINNGATWANIGGATAATFDPGVITETTLYRRKGRRSPCTTWINSNVVTKVVKPFPVASIINYPVSSGYLCELTDYDFEAADAGAGATYAWDFSGFGVPTTAQGPGPHYTQFDVPNADVLSSGTVGLVTELNGCVSTDNRALTFRPEITFDSIVTVDPAVCSVKDGIISIYADYPVGSSVEYSVDGGLTWSGGFSVGALGAGVYDVRVRYLGNECEERFGAVALSDPPPQADIFVSSSEECTSQTVVVEAVATAGAPVFTWTFGNGAIPNTASGAGPHSVYFTEGGFANIAVTLEEAGCIGVRDTNISIVDNFIDGGNVLGGETLCSTYDPTEIIAGSNPSGGIGGTLVFQWEYRDSDGLGGWSAWQDVVGAVSPSFDPGLIAATTQFRRKARRAPCTDWVVSNSVTATLVTKPHLGDDTFNTVCPGYPHADNVNGNDLDLVNADYSLLVFPTNGTLDFEADGEFIYDPNSTFCGTDEFYYLVCNDNTGCCDTAQVIIDLTDSEAPTIVNVPDDITISCDDQVPVPDAVDITENCQTVSLNLDEYTTQGTGGCEYNNYEWVRIWNGVDYCSNNATASQTVNIQDMTAPDIYRIYTLPNGKKMVAGVMENVSHHWKTVSLPIQFGTQPVILTQVSSRNEANPVNARLRNVSTTQFQVTLQEEEGNDGLHTQENVAWVAFEKGAMSGDDAFEVSSWLMTNSVDNLAFGQSFGAVPNLFAAVQTNNEKDPVNVRVSNIGTNGMDAWLEEETSSDPETTHNLESIGYVAIENTGDLTTDSGEVFGEVGTVLLTDALSTIEFSNKYHNAVVILSAMPHSEHEPVTARVVNISETSFEVQLEEWDYLDGVHAAEMLSYLVIEGSLPLDRYVDCDDIPDPMTVGIEIIAVDNCDATIELVMTESDYNFNCQTDTTFTRTWATKDDCGNETSLVQTFTLKDTEPPVFTAPENVTIVCGTDKDDLTITGDVEDETDNCADDVEAVYADNMSNLVGCNGYIMRTWTATDHCGNVTFLPQLIFISPLEDADKDGVVDHFDLDDDNDGIPDLTETNADFDGDGIPNYLDRDSDNDGIPDLIESGGVDQDGDGVVDNFGLPNWDFDADGLAYGYDGNDGDTTVISSVTFNTNTLQNDRDGDGTPNYQDRDSDNDGISDIIEAGGVDTNGDGIIDYPSPGNASSLVDADMDGFADTYDPDNDQIVGIENANEPLIKFDGTAYSGGKPFDRPDFDGDKMPDFMDSDSDNDGIGDLIEAGGIDTDGDARLDLNGFFIDANNDGFSDVYVNYPLVATQVDGPNEDGRPSDVDGNGTIYTVGDLDLDGQPNHRDLDSDADNITDIFETGMFQNDSDGDGILDNWSDSNSNGFDDVLEAALTILTEGEGATADGRPEDSGDADESAYLGAAADGEFAEANGTPDVDDDADGIPNFLDTDSDNDLLLDGVEDKDFDGKQSPGETGAYNPDSDFDDIKDGIEDWNRNGRFDFGETDALNPNTDGDPLLDGEEDINFNGLVDPIESDPRNPCDPMLNEACRGLVLDIKIALMGAAIEGDTNNLMRDDMRGEFILPAFEPYSNLTHINHVGEDAFVEIPDSLASSGYNPMIIGGANGYGNGVVASGNWDPTGSTFDPTGSSGFGFGYGMSNGANGHREWCADGMFWTTGNDAPVDWVLVEIRSALEPDSIIATRSALLQRDGDIRDIDGQSYLTFGNIPSGSFYVAVRHRNHLGVMTATPLILSPDVTKIDFSDETTPVYGDNSMADLGDKMALWPGDLNGDERVIYQGPGNDVLKLFQEVILAEENTDVLANFILSGYRVGDFNLDGKTIYQGPGNERAKILFYTILGSSDNSLGLANFILLQNLP